MGKKLTKQSILQLGYPNGKWLKPALKEANKRRLQGVALLEYLDSVLPPPALALHGEPKPFAVNIRAENELEQQNVDQVLATMRYLMKTPTLVNGAVMPDACPTGPRGSIPVGGVAVAEHAIHPGMHSADICCSVMLSDFGKADPRSVMDKAMKITHFGTGGRKYDTAFELPEKIAIELKNHPYLKSDRAMRLARSHMGTQGDGNHFLFIGFSKSTGNTMLVTHHGSRGLGAFLFQKGMQIAEEFRKELSPNTLKWNAWIPYDSEEGQLYWDALQIIRQWTKQNHASIHNAIAQSLHLELEDQYWNEHNFVFKKENLFYHAKGATPLDNAMMPDSNGLKIIPLNMAQPMLIVRGTFSESNLGFAPHGAGRNLSRTKHRKLVENSKPERLLAKETKDLDIRFYSGKIDVSELPSAYKNAEFVRSQMQEFGLGEIVDEILPYGSIMAGG